MIKRLFKRFKLKKKSSVAGRRNISSYANCAKTKNFLLVKLKIGRKTLKYKFKKKKYKKK